MVPPLAAATAACWLLSAVLLRRAVLAESPTAGVPACAAADPTTVHASAPDLAFVSEVSAEEPVVADSGDPCRWLLVPRQPAGGGNPVSGSRGCCCCGVWGWDVWVGGMLPFAAGWLGLSALFMNISAANGCRRACPPACRQRCPA
jgi:hypothetical protein